jgi:hypothetical protein
MYSLPGREPTKDNFKNKEYILNDILFPNLRSFSVSYSHTHSPNHDLEVATFYSRAYLYEGTRAILLMLSCISSANSPDKQSPSRIPTSINQGVTSLANAKARHADRHDQLNDFHKTGSSILLLVHRNGRKAAMLEPHV